MSAMLVYVPGPAAVVLDSPHSGVAYPDDFRDSCDLKSLVTLLLETDPRSLG